MQLYESWPWQGLITIKIFDLFQQVIEEIRIKNLIVDAGRNLVRDAIRGAVTDTGIHYVALGGPFTTLTTGLTNGQSGITSLAVVVLASLISSGASITLINASGTTQAVTLSSQANAGATSISVNSFTANAAYATGSSVMRTPAAGQTALDSEQFRKALTTNSAPATGAGKTTTYIAPGEANTWTTEEIGWFAGSTATATAGSGVMLARVLYHRAKAATESIQIDRTDQF